MKKLFISLVLVMLYTCSAHAMVSLSQDVDTIAVGKTFHLIITEDGGQHIGVPDLGPLQDNFIITGTSRSSNYSIINGAASLKTEWIVALIPKKTGVLTIPVLQVGSAYTDVSSIKVTGANHASTTNAKALFLKTTVDIKEPYLHQQVMYKVKVYINQQLGNVQYLPPTVQQAIMHPLGDKREYQENINGKTYLVHELQYVIFPQKSGPLIIGEPELSGTLYGGGQHNVTVRGPAIKLQVKPQPSSIKAKAWLPVSKIQLQETYADFKPKMQEGSTFTRTIRVSATGSMAQLLPELPIKNSDNWSVYLEKPTEKNQILGTHLVGQTETKITYLLKKAGAMTIPELQIPWFDTKSDQMKMATLPALNLLVTKSVQSPFKTVTKAKEGFKTKSSFIHKAWWVAGFFALLWIFTVLLWWFNRHRPLLKNSLKEVCLHNDAPLAQKQLLLWGREQFPNEMILTLADLNQLVEDPNLNKEIKRLEEVLYGAKNLKWQGKPLWQAVEHYRKPASKKKTSKKDSLPPLEV